MMNANVSLENGSKDVIAQLVPLCGEVNRLDIVASHHRNHLVLNSSVVRQTFGALATARKRSL